MKLSTDMKRRSFIRQAGLGISGAVLAPNIMANGMMPALVNSQYVPLRETEGQIRHGVFAPPQTGYKNKLISFPWLDDAHKTKFFGQGLPEASAEKDIDITSLLINDPKSGAKDAIQVMNSQEGISVLREGKSFELDTSKKGFTTIPGKKLKKVKMEMGHLSGFKELKRKIAKNTQAYLQVIKGNLIVNDINLEAGIGLCLSETRTLQILPTEACHFILLHYSS